MKESCLGTVFWVISWLEGVPNIVWSRWQKSWSRTSFSMSLDTKGGFETGLKCLSTFGSSEGFFKRSFTTADFIHEGKMLVAKDWFTMVVNRGTTWSEHSNSKDVGIGSRTHVLGDIYFTHFNTASWVTLSSPHKGVPEKCRLQSLCEGGWTTACQWNHGSVEPYWQKSQKRPVEADQWGRQKAAEWMYICLTDCW